MGKSELSRAVGLPLDRVDGHLKVTGGLPTRMNTRPKGALRMVSSFPHRSVRVASSKSTRVMQSARPACCSS